MRITGGDEPVYVATRPRDVQIPVLPLVEGEPIKFNIEKRDKDFLQLVASKDGVVIVPLSLEQRTKFAVQDATGEDLAKLDGWLAEMGMFSGASKDNLKRSRTD